ncbi:MULTISPECIES: M23 family metallopeptidase [unclassified Kribbella]|uniref:M23 family metallopeptidase n=1 Tax=unclassified Kribbella TaxID=2644121 RepID=UPI00301A4EFC
MTQPRSAREHAKDRNLPSSRRPRGATTARHRVPRRTAPGNAQLVGLAAALAAAAGSVGFGPHLLGSPGSANSTVDAAASNATTGETRLSALATARIQRRQLGTRGDDRPELTDTQAGARQAAAARLAVARAAKLDVYRVQTLRRAVALARAKTAAKRAEAEAAARAEAEARAAAAAVELPVSGYRITAVFGQGGDRWARNHTGTDFAAPTGTRVGALMQGVVISAGWAGPYGNQIRIRHADGTESWYNHLSRITVSSGEQVDAGEQIGAVGSTGNSTGPHLHLEIRPGGGGPVDPLRWLRAKGLDP